MKRKYNTKISYLIDEDTILRLRDGNRFGSMFILKLLEKKFSQITNLMQIFSAIKY